MKTLTEKQFVKWAVAHGMGLDEGYPDSAILKLKPYPDLDRFWSIPPEPERRPYFLSMMLTLMGEWDSCYVWRHTGSWSSRADPKRPNDVVEFQILSGLGLPMGTADIIQFRKSDFGHLVTLLFSTSVFGWSVNEDVYVVPDHAQEIMQTDHHGVMHVSFRDSRRMKQFIKGMLKEKFPLPDDLPDSTFRRPKWMKGR